MGRVPCCDKNGLKRGPWTAEEDEKLVDYIQKHGYGNWRTLPKNAGLQRCGKSCRLRWTNYLRPDIKRGRFTFQEEETIIQLHSILGNKWSAIASRLPGRTDNEIKNYWNTHIRKRLLRMGIDPVTHSPRLDLLDISSILSSSLYNSSQVHMSRFFGVQPLVNPELLKLASSLVEAQRGNQNLCSTQNDQHYNHDQLYNPQIENQIQSSFLESDQTQELQPCSSLSTPCVSYPSSINNFSPQYAQFSDWQSGGITCGLTQEYVPIPSFNDYTTDQSIMDPTMSEISGFHYSNSSNQSFGFASVLSTPSSSSTPLNSNSTYGSSEDERENYGSNNLLKFDVPEILDINYEFM